MAIFVNVNNGHSNKELFYIYIVLYCVLLVNIYLLKMMVKKYPAIGYGGQINETVSREAVKASLICQSG